jgi:hypothetical protein
MNGDKIIQDQINIYRDNFLANKDSSIGTFQNDRATQHLRFERILKPFNDIITKEITFHDFGCGCCDMYDYMIQNNIACKYSGTEIIQEMIDHAKQKFPDIELYNRNVLKEKVTDKYNLVVFSGGLYLPGNIPQNEWKTFVFDIIHKMWEMSTVGISFNLLSTYSTYKDDRLFYMDPNEMFDYCCKHFSRFVTLDQSYPLYEWTISIFKKEYIQEKYPQPELIKYLK